MKRSSGPNSKHSRNLKGRPAQSPSKALSEIPIGATVRINVSTRSKNGRPHLRFNRQVANIVGKQGAAYKVSVKMGNKTKVLVISGDHLAEMNA